MRAFLRRLTGDWAEADDLAQDTFVAAWANLTKLRAESEAKVWLCGIAYRKFLASRRSLFRRLARQGKAIAGDVDRVSPSEQADTRMDLIRALQTLSVEQRGAVSLCLGDGATHEEAARILHLPLGTVKSHLARGREKLIAALGDEHDG